MDKLKRLKGILSRYPSAVVAFSGGADSSFLLKTARDVIGPKRLLAVTSDSDTYTNSELRQAVKFAGKMGVRNKVIRTLEMKNSNFTKNDSKRCYYCKRELFGRLKEIAEKSGFEFILDASNTDDRKDYRPGDRAKKEFKIKSPLQEAGFTKKDIRFFSKKMKLMTWDAPAMACLASRIPYGIKIKKSDLRKIEKTEEYIKHLGVKNVRVRFHNNIARIEVDKKDIKRFFNKRFCDRIVRRLKKAGFCYVALDLEGYRTGSLNEMLK